MVQILNLTIYPFSPNYFIISPSEKFVFYNENLLKKSIVRSYEAQWLGNEQQLSRRLVFIMHK